MVSGPRGEKVPVSIYRIASDLQVSPFARDLMNISALAFGPPNAEGRADLFASSRSEGTIYRITAAGAISVFAEGMGIATGIAFDREGSLYVGDRSGTIFKLTPRPSSAGKAATAEIFVFATLEPSVAFYHLCFRADGTLLVTAPTTSSHQPIYAIDPHGSITTFFRGLGRPQGMAFDMDGNLYVAASLQATVASSGLRQALRTASLPQNWLSPATTSSACAFWMTAAAPWRPTRRCSIPTLALPASR